MFVFIRVTKEKGIAPNIKVIFISSSLNKLLIKVIDVNIQLKKVLSDSTYIYI